MAFDSILPTIYKNAAAACAASGFAGEPLAAYFLSRKGHIDLYPLLFDR